MSIDIKLISQVRELTGAGIAAVNSALKRANNNVEEAINILRKEGSAIANKKSGNATNIGLIVSATAGLRGALVEIKTETDFSTKNDFILGFIAEVQKVAPTVNSREELLQAKTTKGSTISEELTACIGAIGENITLNRAEFIKAEHGILGVYTHGVTSPGVGSKAAIVSLESSAMQVPGEKQERLADFAKQLAMQVVAFSPVAVSIDDVDPKLVDNERAILAEKSKALNHPEHVTQKMVTGGLQKFYNESVLLEQDFIAEEGKKIKVQEVLKNLEKEIGHEIKIKGFIRL